MAKPRHPESRIREILAAHAAGTPASDLIEKHKISSATFYNWKGKYGEKPAADAPRRGRPRGSGKAKHRVAAPAVPAAIVAGPAAGSLAEENTRLKVMIVDLMLQVDRLKAQPGRR